MRTIGNKKLCESCFAEIKHEPCPCCGFSRSSYMPAPMVLTCGTILFGKYIIGKTLGVGGFGITYLAYDVKEEKRVAIKEYFPSKHVVRINETEVFAKDPDSAALLQKGVERFYNEAKIISQFNSDPNIINVYEFFGENNTMYFSMEYLTGMTLKNYVEKRGVINTTQGVNVAVKLSMALRRLHEADVLHRDVSPENIMLCSDGTIKLIDFGAARQIYPQGSQMLSVILTPGFAPFEQYQSKGKQGPWTDIYSLGASIFYAMTLKIPEDPSSRQISDDDFDENIYNIYEPFFEVLKRCTMINPAERYQSVPELINDLGAIRVELQPIYPFGEEQISPEQPEPETPQSEPEPEPETLIQNEKKKFKAILIASIAGGVGLLLVIILLIILLASN